MLSSGNSAVHHPSWVIPHGNPLLRTVKARRLGPYIGIYGAVSMQKPHDGLFDPRSGLRDGRRVTLTRTSFRRY